MNTIEEILKKKREQCKNCKNRNNDQDLCKITITNDRKARCFSYEQCMKNKCKTCKNSEKCDD